MGIDLHIKLLYRMVLPSYYCTQPVHDNTHGDILQHVLHTVKQKERTVWTEQKSEKLHKCIEILLSVKVSRKDTTRLLCQVPDILTYPVQKIESQCLFLRQVGFQPADVALLIYRMPKVITLSTKVILRAIDNLQTLGFKEGKLQMLLANNPDLLSLNKKSMTERYSQLLGVFRKSDILLMVYDQPSLLTDSWQSIEDRMHYVSTGMGMDQKHMIDSGMFNYSLRHIRTRHLFLLRAGLYEKPDKHGVTQTLNQTLKRILQTSDKVFAHKMAGVSVQEVEVFAKIVKMEIEGSTEEKYDNETDEDSDDEEEEEEWEISVEKKQYYKKPKTEW